jgi:rubrerythrin
MKPARETALFKNPPPIKQPNVFPLDWPESAPITYELFELAKKQTWDPAKLPWEELRSAKVSAEERLAMGYWFSLLGIFDASAPPVFARALMEMYQAHEEDGVRKCFFTMLRDEVNHEEICRRTTTSLLPGNPNGPLSWKPKTPLEKTAHRNIQWAYHNGARYWNGYLKAYEKYRLPILFTSFLMGEVAATTLFHEMSKAATIPLFREVFRSVSRDESRHARMALYLAQRSFPTLPQEEKDFISRQLRAGFIFLSMILFKPFPGQFWELPPDFVDNHNRLQEAARAGGLGILSEKEREAAWRNAMLRVKGIVEKHGIAFPAMPEVGISGEEYEPVEAEGLIPVF